MSEQEKAKQRRKLSRTDILAVKDLQTTPVFVPEWDGEVLVRTMCGRERDEFEATIQTKTKAKVPDTRGLKELLLSLTLVDEAGVLLFPGEEGIKELSTKSGKVIEFLFQAAAKANGIGEQQVEAETKN